MNFQYYLDDQWWMFIWHNFSFMMVIIPSLLASVVKLIAKIHPDVPSNEIIDLIKTVFTKPGEKAEQ